MTKANSKYFSFPFNNAIVVAEFSPFEWSHNLLACCSSSHLVICDVKTSIEQGDSEDVTCSCTALREYHHPSHLTHFAWSPETVMSVAPRMLRFCTAALDKKLRLFTSDLQNEDIIVEINDHEDFINGVCFQPITGELVATVSDDQMCRIFRLDGSLEIYFALTSPGMSVAWHSSESGKLLVAEKKGLIRLYSVQAQQPIMSLDCMHSPLLAADWSPSEPLRIACVAGSDWFIFDTSRSSRALETRQAHSENAIAVRWSACLPHLLATLGRPGAELKVYSCRNGQIVMSSKVGISRWLSWHHHLPLLAVGGDRCVHVWFMDSI